ncbi:ABC transporter permease [Robertmurraya massiliosenegalensis]|uniref:ABC transporter permease n=1 Tax=Robertmurraya TaxID=2837507 RepID=UPI0039A5FBBB
MSNIIFEIKKIKKTFQIPFSLIIMTMLLHLPILINIYFYNTEYKSPLQYIYDSQAFNNSFILPIIVIVYYYWFFSHDYRFRTLKYRVNTGAKFYELVISKFIAASLSFLIVYLISISIFIFTAFVFSESNIIVSGYEILGKLDTLLYLTLYFFALLIFLVGIGTLSAFLTTLFKGHITSIFITIIILILYTSIGIKNVFINNIIFLRGAFLFSGLEDIKASGSVIIVTMFGTLCFIAFTVYALVVISEKKKEYFYEKN